MKLRKLSFRNFKSYSNILTEISFDDSSSLNLIVGENGTGKTSVAECITYLLYGKLDSFTASDIPNRVNKNFYGKLELDCDGHQMVIERGLNPSLFKVDIDGKTIDTAGKLNVQTELEENYFHIPYTVFHNVLSIEVGEVKSLLDLNVADKRNIIDKICGFTIYNFYGKIVKEDVKALDMSLNNNGVEIRTTNSNISQYDHQIEEIKENISSQEEIDELVKKLKEAEELKATNDEMLTKIRAAKEQLRTTNIQKAGEYKILESKIVEIDRRVKLIDGGKCPTCGTSLEGEDFQKERESLLAQRRDYEEQMRVIVKLTKSIQSKIDTATRKEQEIQRNTNSIGVVDIKSDLQYKQTMKTKSTETIESLKSKLIENLAVMNDEKKRLEEEKTVLDFLNHMFGDGGIKRYISGKYIPIINGLIAGMMEYMNLNYNVVFDSNFDAKIIQNGMNVKYCTLSKGEKRRVDFATVIAFIKFLKLQFGELNLLFLDEIFSNVDVNGVNDIVQILKDLSEDLNLNIYLIHHAKLEGVMFDKVMQTKKIDGFSKIELI